MSGDGAPRDLVTEIQPGATGMWVFGDTSGCVHTLDLDEDVYIVWMPPGFGLPEGEDDPDFDEEGGEMVWIIDGIHEWPQVNRIFQVEGALEDEGELTELVATISSDYVTWIAKVPPESELGAISLTEFEAVSQVPPPSAWLLIGDEASMPTPEEMESGEFSEGFLWTAPQMAQRGDLVFMYFVSPTKEIRYAARVLDSPFFDPYSEVNAIGTVSSRQWWVELSEFVPVPPVSFSELSALHGDGLILRGKPSHYISPRVYDGLMDLFGDLDERQRRVLQRPVGEPDLPDDASTIEVEDLRELTSAALHREAMVEQYVVEPLLRLALAAPHGVEVRPQVRLDSGIADYAIYDQGTLIGVVEVKYLIRVGSGESTEASPDMDQLLRYMDATGVPGMLIDAHDLLLVAAGDGPDADVSVSRLTRNGLTAKHLARIAGHFRL